MNLEYFTLLKQLGFNLRTIKYLVFIETPSFDKEDQVDSEWLGLTKAIQQHINQKQVSMTTKLKTLKNNTVGQTNFQMSIIQKLDEQGKQFAECKEERKKLLELMNKL